MNRIHYILNIALLLLLGAVTPAFSQTITGNIYGGGEMSSVGGNTSVTINSGLFGGSIFGGGEGKLKNDGTVSMSADIGTHNNDGTLKESTGDTHVTINGGEIVYGIGDEDNLRNIYGGGNLACNVAGNTSVTMTKGMITAYSFTSSPLATDAWRYFYDNSMKPNQQKIPICSVFGAGYGTHTDVAGNTSVSINIPGTADIRPADGVAFTHAELEAIDRLALRLKPDTKLSAQFVPAVHGGGFDGTVGAYDPTTKGIKYDKTSYTSQTNVTIEGQPFIFNVYGGGLGSKSGADATGGVNSHVGAVYGATKVDIQGGLFNGDVFGGGAGIESEQDIPNPFGGGSTIKMPYTYAAQVMRETDVTISGNTTVIYGNVYGGGDIANTGWYDDSARPTMTDHVAQQNHSKAKLDYTTSLKLMGGNILGSVFGGGNGRTKAQMTMSMFVGTVCGSTNVSLNGTKVWSHVYGGGNMGTVFTCQTIAASKGESGRPMATGVTDGCTNVDILDGMVAKDIFGGGFGNDPGTGVENITSADIYGNTYVYVEKYDLEFSKYWKPRTFLSSDATLEQMMAEVTGRFLDQSSAGPKRNTESDITHNLYGGGNMACDIKGNTHVYMTGAPTAPADFNTTDYYKECIANVAKPHFSVFGGGFGDKANVTGNAYSDINLRYGTGLHSIIGGGMNGSVGDSCLVHVGNDPHSLVHYVYGGGYYAPCGSTKLTITRGTILENVYGGTVMGNINAAGASTDVATNTTIGLKAAGDGASLVLKDENGTTLNTYSYDDHQNQITIGGDVYGANDVSGTVNGVAQLTIYGGTIGGNVYGAGNGDHIGYYEPDKLSYDLGTHGADNYFIVDHGVGKLNGKTYVGRPQTIGGVNLTIEGNTAEEKVRILGQVFGGGNSCTVGAWDKDLLASDEYHSDPHLVRDDPDYFLGGGKIHVNLGSHLRIGRTHKELMGLTDPSLRDKYLFDDENVSGLYMGCSGRHLATQERNIEDNYYHHFYDPTADKYYPGFAVLYGVGAELSPRAAGLRSFNAYLNNILVWTDDIQLTIPEDAEDIWLANFVGGGFRGSMKLKTDEGKFDYVLPEGVTIGHDVVGGAYNTDVVYRLFSERTPHVFDTDGNGHYIYETDYARFTQEDDMHPEGDYKFLEYDKDDNVTGIIRFYYDGGMLAEGPNLQGEGHKHVVHADPREEGISESERDNRYATSYFEPLTEGDNMESEATKAELYTANKGKALLHLSVSCAMEPEVSEVDGVKSVHGGNVYGGCFQSGLVSGDTWIDYGAWLSPSCSESTDPLMKYFFDKSNNMHIYDEAHDIERNNAMNVFGAGYGEKTHTYGDIYLYIKAVDQVAGGDANMTGRYPYIFNAFGGSNMGRVEGNTNVYYAVGKQGTLLGSLYGGGYKGSIEGNTFVELAEGFVTNVYGGSRQANIGGASHVWAYDGKARGITDANHLIICNLYGGNDIAGTISGSMPAKFTESKWNDTPTGPGTPRESLTGKLFNTYVEISADDNSADRGFPLVGSVFAGGNGEAWVSEVESGPNPEVAYALLEIEGGSTLRAFGGGNKATVTGNTYIFTDAKSDNFANVTFTEYQKNIMTKVFFNGMKTGFKWDETQLTIDPFHVVRLFGGNNLATMNIQPTWNLKCGKIENVYSGGNMGDMTYYNPDGKAATADGQIGSQAGVENNTDGSNSNYSPRGLSITIDSPDIYINSLFGGCRMSSVRPDDSGEDDKWPEGNDGDDFYGATVNITDGYIENVYGGNDVSGIVHHGTNVNISGAVSGNVYGSGNGFYLYKYDTTVNEVTEDINDKYGIFYRVPERDANGDLYDVRGLLDTDTHKLLTINAVRPSVEKAFLNISGLEHYPAGDSNPKRVAYVKGNVFCGGNASTITGDGSFSKFKIGSYVTLNGVFMGSDGKAFTDNDQIAAFAAINDFEDMGAETDFNAGYETDKAHNPILLNAYMMAVDMMAHPKDFNLKLPLREAHIGTYCGGGNRGSMLVDKTVNLPFHHDLIIYDKIVAACLDANVTYNQNGQIVKSWGGYTRKIADNATYGNTKIKMEISSQFAPMVMDVPDDRKPTTLNKHGENFVTAAEHDFLYDNRTEGTKYTYQEFNDLFLTEYESDEEFFANEGQDHWWKEAPGIYAPACNIYGGCYQSGEVEGDIELSLHSNMLRYANKNDLDRSIEQNIACFNVYGAGFGQDSHVWGNVSIVMDRCLDTDIMGSGIATRTLSSELADKLGGDANFDIMDGQLNNDYGTSPAQAYDCSYPSLNNIVGGGRNGKLIGNSRIEMRNGLVYGDVAGGCYASDMYGSTHVIVGYPKYYVCTTSGEFTLDRADKWNDERVDIYGNPVIKQTIRYLKGDLVPDNVYQQIVAANAGQAGSFAERVETPSTLHPTDGTTWDDVIIKVGRGIYGGGYSLANSASAAAGTITTHKLDDIKVDSHYQNFDDRYGYRELLASLPGETTQGFGGNASIMVGDRDPLYTGADAGSQDRDHIRISTLNAKPVSIPVGNTVIGKFVKETIDGKDYYTHQGNEEPNGGVQYYDLSGEGGIYGDGHLTFCEGFRTADITRYGWAEGTAKHPVLMNTFQRMDLLSVNDCCLMLQGAQDFATDQIDATIYSITRINELRMKSSLNADGDLGEISSPNGMGGIGPQFGTRQQRNYLAFFNNVHYLGAIVTNDTFDDAQNWHNASGRYVADSTYISRKLDFIDKYDHSPKMAADVTAFKKRNVGTARNAIGINNGYCLRIQNQEYVGEGNARTSQTYYGPVVGVCEVKLLTLIQGEGGGYVYADNIHEYPNKASGQEHFLMSSGNFVFPGIINTGDDGDQYIVDDCFLLHFGSPNDLVNPDPEHDFQEAHYWYVEGNKYFFTTTLTGFTYKKDPTNPMIFNLTKTDPNIILSGMQNGSKLNVKKIEWISEHRANYEARLPDSVHPDRIDDYEFDMEVGGSSAGDWQYDMPRATDLVGSTGKGIGNDNLPQFNIRLQDKFDNSGEGEYVNHLDEPEVVKIYLEGKTRDEMDNEQTYEYTITLNIVYLQGPTFEGGVNINNCALPGEWIGFSSDGLKIKTPELMPVTAASWRIVPLKEIDEHGVWHWDIDQGIVIPEDDYSENPETQNIEGHITALYKQNEYNIAYVFTAGGYDFPVMPEQTLPRKEQRMIVVHNYHRMKDVIPQQLQIETMPTVENKDEDAVRTHHPAFAEAKLYMEDEADLRAFIQYLNLATESNAMNIPVGLTGLDIILQKDITLTEPLPIISQHFDGTLHGDGHHIDLNGHGTSLLGNRLYGKVYNLGLIGGTIASTGDVVNSYEYVDNDDFRYGHKAYELSHTFTPGSDVSTYDNYVHNYYANGDYQYATTDRAWSLRTDVPHYGRIETRHNTLHSHDAARWQDADSDAAVDVLTERGAYIPLHDGTATVADRLEMEDIDIITYTGLPEGYANDYLFFGQHLDQTDADAYPVCINQVAKGDADKSKGGNRVYETAGYHQRATNDGFYYNRDAWALQPTLTAIDYTNMTAEPDGAATLPASFSVDSNRNYDSDGHSIANVDDNDEDYTNASVGHVSQNLLVYNDGQSIFAYKDADGSKESEVAYHNLVKGGDDKFSTNYLHLVDRQDFNAPIAFDVKQRAWYERLPQNYRNVTTYGYDHGSAWEGIALPFTATKVTAEKNGEISHFYGADDATDHSLHHEYWLRGFMGTSVQDDETLATFARPAITGGEQCFVESHQTAAAHSYLYPANTYFTSLADYNGHYNTRDDEGDDLMENHDKAWYAEGHTFADYVPLTAEVPYIVAFPGNDFYEFTMESFYHTAVYGSEDYPQRATFESGATTIGVSDTGAVSTTVDGYIHHATYLHETGTGKLGINNTGTAFVTDSDGSYMPITPFRTYIIAPPSTPSRRRISIAERMGEQMPHEAEVEEEEETADLTLRIYVEGNDLVVESPVELTLPIYSVNGIHLSDVHVVPGVTRHPLSQGIYLVSGKKYMVK